MRSRPSLYHIHALFADLEPSMNSDRNASRGITERAERCAVVESLLLSGPVSQVAGASTSNHACRTPQLSIEIKR